MLERIYTIPIMDSLQQTACCPLCDLRGKAEEKALDFILGAAMMEPRVRIETNRLGFCPSHLRAMMGRQQRLSLALLLQSLLGELEVNPRDGLLSREHSCYLCDRVEIHMAHFRRTFALLWRSDPDFPALCTNRHDFCRIHTTELMRAGRKHLPFFHRKSFLGWLDSVAQSQVSTLKGGVDRFCQSFDHRFTLAPEDRDALDRAVSWLSGD